MRHRLTGLPAAGRDFAPHGRRTRDHACLPVGRGFAHGAPWERKRIAGKRKTCSYGNKIAEPFLTLLWYLAIE